MRAPEVQMPAGMEVIETRPKAADLVIAGGDPYRGLSSPARPGLTIRWPTRSFAIVAVVIAILFASFMALVVAALIAGEPVDRDMIEGILAIGGMTVGSVYLALTRLFNRMVVHADGEELSAMARPIPTPERLRLPVRDVAELYLESNADSTHSVLVRTRTDRRYRLVTVPTVDQARFLHERLVRHLGLEPEPPGRRGEPPRLP